MNLLDVLVKRDRKKRYKYLKKLFKVRDMAKQYIDTKIRISEMVEIISETEIGHMSATKIAYLLIKADEKVKRDE